MAVSLVTAEPELPRVNLTDAQTQENGRTPRPDFKRKLVVVGDGGELMSPWTGQADEKDAARHVF